MSRATLLLVDDELIVRRLLGDALARAGYHVEVASSDVEALDRLGRPGIDMLLVDLRLGDADGVQVMQAARRLWPRLPIIMLTANGSLSSAIAAVRCGVADYLLKPIDLETLRERVAAILNEYLLLQARAEQLTLMYSQLQAILQGEGWLPETHADISAQPAGVRGYRAGPLSLDVQYHTVLLHQQPIEVTPSEFAILVELLRTPGAVVPCLRLTEAIQTAVDDEEAARQLIRPHIVRLRRKLERDPQQPSYLLSVRGLGYRWANEPAVVQIADCRLQIADTSLQCV
ncbi:MAG: response regulator transcription factor [Chloroflexota bacterium]|nr:response regulator transcription factor [Chloroflexota bacterium]